MYLNAVGFPMLESLEVRHTGRAAFVQAWCNVEGGRIGFCGRGDYEEAKAIIYGVDSLAGGSHTEKQVTMRVEEDGRDPVVRSYDTHSTEGRADLLRALSETLSVLEARKKKEDIRG